jgi:hypothetical protein
MRNEYIKHRSKTLELLQCPVWIRYLALCHCCGFLDMSGSVAHELSAFLGMCGEICGGRSPERISPRGQREADLRDGLQIIVHEPPFGIVISQPAWTVEDGQTAIRVTMYPDLCLDEMTAVSGCWDL